MKPLGTALILSIAFFWLAACGQTSTQLPVESARPEGSATAEPTLPPAAIPTVFTPTSAPTSTASAMPTATSRPTSDVSATPTLSPTPTMLAPEERLAQVMQSDGWAELELPPEQAALWEAFASREKKPDAAQLHQLNGFLQEWGQYQELLDGRRVPEDAPVAFRVLGVSDDDGVVQWRLFAVAPEDARPYLVARDAKYRPAGLLLAPEIDGLVPVIDAQAAMVDYLDAKGRVVLKADARQLENYEWRASNAKKQITSDQVLFLTLQDAYAKNHAYSKTGLFPRYYFPVEGVEVGFFLLERSLSLVQLYHMNEALQLFDAPDLQPLKAAFFGRDNSVVIYAQLRGVLGLTYSGTHVMELNRKDLLGNRYQVASVLAHEGSHVLQGAPSRFYDVCKTKLAYEVGNMKIPDGFLEWGPETLLQHVRDQSIGAYHVSYWVLHHLDPRNPEINWIRGVIRTGTADGQPIVYCK